MDPEALPTEVRALDAAAERLRTPLGTGALAWRLWGAGPPLVLLHGASGSWTHWLRNIEALARRFRVVVPDLPGFGDSDDLPGQDTLAGPPAAEALADAVSAALDRVVPPPAPLALAGFSFGGIVAGLVAARLAARVRTLVLAGPNGLGLPHGPLPALERVRPRMRPAEVRAVHRVNLGRLMFGDPARVDDVAVAVQIANLRRARFRSGDIPESDVLGRALPAVRARITGLWGARDVYALGYLDQRRAALARFQPALDFRVLDGAGHWAIYEAAAAANAALVEMLGAAG